MTRARLTYEQRKELEDALKRGESNQEIFERFGMDTYQLYKEKQLGGWSRENQVYSADKAQKSLR